MFNSIVKTNNYGITTSKSYNNCLELNEFKTINGASSFKINFENYLMNELLVLFHFYLHYIITLIMIRILKMIMF